MQLDIHYYAIYRLAILAGFSKRDAELIAYASQYVDDATESKPIYLDNDQIFDPTRTAHYGLNAFKWGVQKKIYMPFHFLPNKLRKGADDFTYVVEKAPTDLTNLLIKHAETPIALGIALHTIADTFSHHEFSGRYHKENSVGKIWHIDKDGKKRLLALESYLLDVIAPNIGHAEAFNFPDYPWLKWRYGNGKKIVRDNVENCMQCIKYIYQVLAKYKYGVTGYLSLNHADDYVKMVQLIRTDKPLKERIKLWQEYTDAPVYDKTKWRRQALKGDVNWHEEFEPHKLKGKKNFDNTNWAEFHRAAYKQRSLILQAIN